VVLVIISTPPLVHMARKTGMIKGISLGSLVAPIHLPQVLRGRLQRVFNAYGLGGRLILVLALVVAPEALYWYGWDVHLLLILLGGVNIVLTGLFWIAILEWAKRK
jgi:hypothetical protein